MRVIEKTTQFDYAAFGVGSHLAKEIEEDADFIRQFAVHSIATLGECLIRVQTRLPDDVFEPWVGALGISVRTGYRAMRAVKVLGGDELRKLRISQTAIYEITKESCPEKAREECLEIARYRFLSLPHSKEIVEKHKDPTDKMSEQTLCQIEADSSRDQPQPVATDTEWEDVDPEEEMSIQYVWDRLAEVDRVRLIDFLHAESLNEGQCLLCRGDMAPKAPKRPSSKVELFNAFWSKVWRKEGKTKAQAAYDKAIDRVRKERDWSIREAGEWINDRATIFAASPQAKDDVKGKLHPTTWLNQGRYDDDTELWMEGKAGGKEITKEDIEAKERREAHIKRLRELRGSQ